MIDIFLARMSRYRLLQIFRSTVFLLSCILFVGQSRAQSLIDASIHASWLQETDVYGIGGSAHFVFALYALGFVPSGAHYFADDDTTKSWSIGLDGRLNLPTLGVIRPYVGTGLERQRLNDESEWLFNLSGGFYTRVRGDRIVPFIEGAYRPADSANPWRFRSGLRFIMRER